MSTRRTEVPFDVAAARHWLHGQHGHHVSGGSRYCLYCDLSGALDLIEELAEAVAAILPHEIGNSHAHERAGIWDDDNRPELAGKPCDRCGAFERGRAALARVKR